MKQKIIFITGPTASGKTELALFLAKKFNGEIINADSRQVYKYLDIGSGKYDLYTNGREYKMRIDANDYNANGREPAFAYGFGGQVLTRMDANNKNANGNVKHAEERGHNTQNDAKNKSPHSSALFGFNSGNIFGSNSGKYLFRVYPRENNEYHLFSIAHPRRNYSLGRWLKDFEKAIYKILKKNKLPIFCGGTILYLKALKEGWILPEVKPNYKLRKELEKKSKEELFEEIKKLDPKRAKNLNPNNKRRLIRALEIIYALGKVPKIKKEPRYDILIIAPEVEKEKLFRKIKLRLKKRVPGIIKEIKKLRKIGLSWQRIISFGLEYKWFGLYVMTRGMTLTISRKDTDINSKERGQITRINADINAEGRRKLIQNDAKNKSPHSSALFGSNSGNIFGSNSGKYLFRVDPRNKSGLIRVTLKTIINLCYQDILRFAKRQLRELKKIKEVVWVKDKRSAERIVENFLKI